MSLSAFEVRLEILKMAQGLVSDEYSYRRCAAIEQWQTQVEAARLSGSPLPPMPELPPFPTESEIIAKANTLNGFVSNSPEITKTSKKST